MCMLHATPHRAYLILVHNTKVPMLDTHPGEKLLATFRQEVTSGHYTNPDVWHPVATELLTFAANRMEDIQSVIYECRGYNYPVCDVIEGIGDFIDCLGAGGFTPASQQARFLSYNMEEDAKRASKWRYGELAQLLRWTSRFKDELPLMTDLITKLDIINDIRLYHEQQTVLRAAIKARTDIFNHKKAIVLARTKELEPLLLNWKFHGMARIEGLSLGTLQQLLHRGYTPSQCRQHILSKDLPRQSWHEAWPHWKKELETLPLDDWNRMHLDRLTNRYQKVSKRSKAIGHHVANMLEKLETGLPLIQYIWPEWQIKVDHNATTWKNLQDATKRGRTLLQEMHRVHTFSEDTPDILRLHAEANAYLVWTSEEFIPSIQAAA